MSVILLKIPTRLKTQDQYDKNEKKINKILENRECIMIEETPFPLQGLPTRGCKEDEKNGFKPVLGIEWYS